MSICTIDGTAYFGRWLLRCKIEKETEITHHVAAEGIICYTEKQKERAEKWLKDSGIEYKQEDLSVDRSLEEKAKGVVYSSRSEAIAHLMEDREPEGEKFKRLLARMDKLEKNVDELRKRP